MPELTNRTFDEIDVGAATQVTQTFYKAEIEMLALESFRPGTRPAPSKQL